MTCAREPPRPTAAAPADAARPADDHDDGGGAPCCQDVEADARACCDEDCLRSVALLECLTGHDRGAGHTSPPPGGSLGGSARCDKRMDMDCGGAGQGPCKSDCAAGCEGEATATAGQGCGSPRAANCCSGSAEPVDREIGACCGGDGDMLGGAGPSERKTDCCSGGKPDGGIEGPNVEPCLQHLEAARRRYSNVFGAMSCLCKALLARGVESCCTTKRKLSRRPSPRALSSRSRTSNRSTERNAFSTNTARESASFKPPFLRKTTCRGRPESTLAAKCVDDCCVTKNSSVDHCGSTRNRSAWIQETEGTSVEVPKDFGSGAHASTDLERADGSVEHVVLSVQGMTCTSCETKLYRSIHAIPSAQNAQASIVLSRAEFDVDQRVSTVEQAIAQLGRATGFVLTQQSTKGHKLFVRKTVDSEHLLDTELPVGVLEVKPLDEEAMIISYDATVVGARELLNRSFGIRLQLAPVRPAPNIAAGSKHVRHEGYMTILSAAMTIPVLVFAWAPLPPHEIIYQSTSLVLATIIQVVVAGPFYSKALRSLVFSRVIEMDLLIVLSTSVSYTYSVIAYAYMVAGRRLSTGEFFASSTLLITLVMIGRFVSAYARQKAVESISISSFQPSAATLVDEDGHVVETIDAQALHYGDVFLVLPETRIVTDGTVLSGHSEVDESMITGESKLIAKSRGSSVVAGSVNGLGLLHVKVAQLPGENTISSITGMVDKAKLSKPKIQEFADRVAGYFVPVIIGITVVVFCIWVAIGIAKRRQSGSESVVNALTYAIAVLIVACPCAVGLAVPMVIVIACGVGAEHGIIFKSAQSIESSWKATHVVFDKTGTLTHGTANVVHEEFLVPNPQSCLPLLSALVSGNRHPSSLALAKHLEQQGVDPVPLYALKTVVGKGVEGRLGAKTVRAGSAKWLGLEDLAAVQSSQSRGLSTLCFTIDDEPQAVFGLADTLRPEAKSIVSDLISRGVVVSIVSGDNTDAVQSVGRDLGLDSGHVKGHCTPQDKQQYVQQLTRHKKHVVIFCGDGSNDAGALAQATVGLHMSQGTDVARSASDAVLMRPDISLLLTLLAISHAASRRILLNFCWAAIYNLFAILLTSGALVDFRIPPQFAGLGEVVSVLPVILIALQMKWTTF